MGPPRQDAGAIQAGQTHLNSYVFQILAQGFLSSVARGAGFLECGGKRYSARRRF